MMLTQRRHMSVAPLPDQPVQH